MELIRRAGLSSTMVLTAATRNAAKALGIMDKVGTIAEGKLADLVILDGDLLKDFSALHNTVAVGEGRSSRIWVTSESLTETSYAYSHRYMGRGFCSCSMRT